MRTPLPRIPHLGNRYPIRIALLGRLIFALHSYRPDTVRAAPELTSRHRQEGRAKRGGVSLPDGHQSAKVRGHRRIAIKTQERSRQLRRRRVFGSLDRKSATVARFLAAQCRSERQSRKMVEISIQKEGGWLSCGSEI